MRGVHPSHCLLQGAPRLLCLKCGSSGSKYILNLATTCHPSGGGEFRKHGFFGAVANAWLPTDWCPRPLADSRLVSTLRAKRLWTGEVVVDPFDTSSSDTSKWIKHKGLEFAVTERTRAFLKSNRQQPQQQSERGLTGLAPSSSTGGADRGGSPRASPVPPSASALQGLLPGSASASSGSGALAVAASAPPVPLPGGGTSPSWAVSSSGRGATRSPGQQHLSGAAPVRATSLRAAVASALDDPEGDGGHEGDFG